MKATFKKRLGLLLVLAVVWLPSALAAQDYRVVKGDLLKVSVFQWPEYSGESRVSDSGTVSLPALGRLTVDGLTLEMIERRIIEKLSTFSEIPNVRVVAEIAEYRPYSVLGAVNEPGRYTYTSGMTVLDAVAVAGGFLAPSTRGNAFRRLTDFTEGRERLDIYILQLWVAIARRARLLAENGGFDEIEFPAELIEFQSANDKTYISDREGDIFAARKSSIEDQIEILRKQSSILKDEIKVLVRHRKEIKRSVNFLEAELRNQSSLLDKGLARRLSVINAEKQVTDMQGEYRQSVVATMKAKKNLSDIDKEILVLQNERVAEINDELISVETDISILLKRIEYQKILLHDSALSALGPDQIAGALPNRDQGFEFTVLRGRPGGERSAVQEVTESTPIMPGDIVKVLKAR